MSREALAAAADLGLDVESASLVPLDGGLIHLSWRVRTTTGEVLLQRLNGEVFDDPADMADNADLAARRIQAAMAAQGDGDPRHHLVFRQTPRGRPWVRDHDGQVWRAMDYIADSRTVDAARPAEVRNAAGLLGRFPGWLEAGSGPRPVAILPGFHDTPARLRALEATAPQAASSRLDAAAVELSRLRSLSVLASRLTSRDLPERLVHNDAKLDNVLVDRWTGEALCVVDLDTVMPGLAAHDFGDLVRSAVTGRPEDEPDPASITVRPDMFQDLATGYLAGAAGWMTAAERSSLLDGALVITYEQAVRFLTDFLAGDRYYAVKDGEHNLRRTRAQLRLLDELLSHEDQLRRLMG